MYTELRRAASCSHRFPLAGSPFSRCKGRSLGGDRAAEEVGWRLIPRQLPAEHPSSPAEAPRGRDGPGKAQDSGWCFHR